MHTHSLVKEADCLNITRASVHCYIIITSEILWIKRLVEFICLFVCLCKHIKHIAGSFLEPQGDRVYGKGWKSEALVWHRSVSSSSHSDFVVFACMAMQP